VFIGIGELAIIFLIAGVPIIAVVAVVLALRGRWRCARCSASNRKGSAFCTGCGTAHA
jgi:hypothetical protein